MDFQLTEEQLQIQQLAREFAEGEFKKDMILKCEREETFPFEIWKKACELGLTGIRFPAEVGGAGLGVLENVLAIEEFCRKDSGVGLIVSCALPGAELVALFGSPEQKEKYLVPFLNGEKYFSIGLTEPDHGCDVKTLSTTAAREGTQKPVRLLRSNRKGCLSLRRAEGYWRDLIPGRYIIGGKALDYRMHTYCDKRPQVTYYKKTFRRKELCT